jgi:N-acylneuraminate cytidylyltransferase/CMP-N,N'-diacetyllegionaminic acid synthase
VLLPTTPLRTCTDVDGAIELFMEKEADSVISYTREAHPVCWHKYINEDKSFTEIFDDTLANRQQLRTSYYPNGAIYVFRTNIIKSRKYYTDKSYAYIMPRDRSVDIDTLEDFQYAEFLMTRRED